MHPAEKRALAIRRAVVESLEGRRLLTAEFGWVDQIGGGGTETVRDVVHRTTDGSVVVVGSFTGTADFDPRPDATANLTSAGGTDAFVGRYTSTGALLWAKRVGGSGNDAATATTFSPAENPYVSSPTDTRLYVTGAFANTVDFNPADGATFNLSSSGPTDAFLLELNLSGNFVRAARQGGAGADEGRAMQTRIVYKGDNVPHTYGTTVVGVTNGLLPGSSSTAVSDNVFSWYAEESGLTTYNVIGDPVANESIEAMAADGTAVGSITDPGGLPDILIYGQGGTLRYGGPGADRATGVVSSFERGVFVVGEFSGTAQFGVRSRPSNGGTDGFLLHLMYGNRVKDVISFGGTGNDTVTDIASGETGQYNPTDTLYIAGSFTGTIDFDPTGQTRLLTSTAGGGSDAYVAKYGVNLRPTYARAYGSTADDAGGELAVDPREQSLKIAGAFRNTVDFNLDPGAVANRTAIGGADGYLLSINQFKPEYGGVLTTGAAGTTAKTLNVDTDAAGNRYQLLSFVGTVDVDPNSGVQNVTLNSAAENVLVKLRTDNSFAWARVIKLDGAADKINVASFASVEVTATDELDVSDEGQSLVAYNVRALSANGTATYYAVARAIDTNGNYIDSRAFGGTQTVIAIGAVREGILGGRYGNGGFHTRFSPGYALDYGLQTGFPDEFTAFAREGFGLYALGRSVTGPQVPTVYSLRFFDTLVFSRVQVTGPAGQSVGEATSIAYDQKTNRVVVGGTVTNPINDFDPRAGTKTLPVGNFIWSLFLGDAYGGGPIPFTATSTLGSQVTVDEAGNLYVMGTFSGTVDANPQAGVKTITSKGGTDVVVQKLDQDHRYVSVLTYGSTGNDSIAGGTTFGGNLYLYGSYRSTVDFNPADAAANRTAKGLEDSYLLRLLI